MKNCRNCYYKQAYNGTLPEEILCVSIPYSYVGGFVYSRHTENASAWSYLFRMVRETNITRKDNHKEKTLQIIINKKTILILPGSFLLLLLEMRGRQSKKDQSILTVYTHSTEFRRTCLGETYQTSINMTPAAFFSHYGTSKHDEEKDKMNRYCNVLSEGAYIYRQRNPNHSE